MAVTSSEMRYRAFLAHLIYAYASAPDLPDSWRELAGCLARVRDYPFNTLEPGFVRKAVTRTLRYIKADEVGCVRFELRSLAGVLKPRDPGG